MRRSVNRKQMLANMDLSVTCTLCQKKIQPAEQQRLSMDGTMRCPHCGELFKPADVRANTGTS